MIRYRITPLYGSIELGACPPDFVFDVFPSYDGWPTEVKEVTVTVNGHERQRTVCEVLATDGLQVVQNPMLRVEVLPDVGE